MIGAQLIHTLKVHDIPSNKILDVISIISEAISKYIFDQFICLDDEDTVNVIKSVENLKNHTINSTFSTSRLSLTFEKVSDILKTFIEVTGKNDELRLLEFCDDYDHFKRDVVVSLTINPENQPRTTYIEGYRYYKL
jgi:hypothetical protein